MKDNKRNGLVGGKSLSAQNREAFSGYIYTLRDTVLSDWCARRDDEVKFLLWAAESQIHT